MNVACLSSKLNLSRFMYAFQPFAHQLLVFCINSSHGTINLLDCALLWYHVVFAFAFTAHRSLPPFPSVTAHLLFSFITDSTLSIYITERLTQQVNRSLHKLILDLGPGVPNRVLCICIDCILPVRSADGSSNRLRALCATFF
jgi:hypothetical protein